MLGPSLYRTASLVVIGCSWQVYCDDTTANNYSVSLLGSAATQASARESQVSLLVVSLVMLGSLSLSSE